MKLQELNGTILHFDEVLTMSARMGALTGDKSWENRYMHYEPQLRNAITETQKLLTKIVARKNVIQTEQANNRLVKMEIESFKWVRQGNPEIGKKLLFSQEYEKHKRAYSEGMKNFISQVDSHIQTQAKTNNRRLLKLIIFCVLFIILSWLGAAFLIRKYFLQRKNAMEIIQNKEASLNEAQTIAYAGSWELNIINGEMTWSDELYRIFGLETGSPVNLFSSMSLLHPRDTRRIQKYIDKGFFPENKFEREVQFLKPNGDWGVGHNQMQEQKPNNPSTRSFPGYQRQERG
jgi:hypothetical protein